MKAIIIVDHINRGQLATLTNRVLKSKYGHNLLDLLKSVGQINVETKPNPVSTVDEQCTAYQILAFLNRFADKARYHNLAGLTGAPSAVDPLEEWGDILARVIREDVPKSRRDRILFQASQMASIVSRTSVVIAYGLDHSPLTSEQFIQATPLQDVASGYIVCYVLDIVRPLETVLSDLTHASYGIDSGQAAHVPDMWEHLAFLRVTKRSEIRRKMRWP